MAKKQKDLNQTSAFDQDVLDDCSTAFVRKQKTARKMIESAYKRNLKGILKVEMGTGSGKTTHVAASQISLLVKGGFDEENGCFSQAPGCKWVVFIVPEKDNRNDFAKALKEKLMDVDYANLSEEEADLHIVVAKSNLDNVKDAINRLEGHLPELCEAESVQALLSSQWDKMLALCGEHDSLQNPSGANYKRWNKMRLEVEREILQIEGAMRKTVAKHYATPGVIQTTQYRKAIESIWPAAKLNRLGWAVIVATPEKALARFDTILGWDEFGRSVMLLSPQVSKSSLTFLDEFDKQYKNWLSFSIGEPVKYDPFKLVSDLMDRLKGCSTALTPLFKGDESEWKKVAFASRAIDPDVEIGHIEQKARYIERKYGELVRALSELDKHYPIRLLPKTSKPLDSTSTPNARGLFSMTYPKSASGKKLIVKPEGSFATIDEEKGLESELDLYLALRNCQNLIERTASLIAIIARTWKDLHGYEDDYNCLSTAVNMIFRGQGIWNDSPDDDYSAWFALAKSKYYNLGSSGKKNDGLARDLSIYSKGVSSLQLHDSRAHATCTYLFAESIPELPEATLASIANEGLVICLSATPDPPTVASWDFEYLDDGGYVIQDKVLLALSDEILELTEKDNTESAELAPEPVPISSTGLFIGPTSKAELAHALVIGLGLSEVVSEKALSKMMDGKLIAEISEALSGDKDLASRTMSQLSRFEKMLRAVADFAIDAKEQRALAMVCLMPRYLGQRPEANSDLEIQLANSLLEAVACSVLGLAKTPETKDKDKKIPEKYVFFARAANWNDEVGAWHRRLSAGYPALLVSPYASAGSSKNLQFELPIGKRPFKYKKLERGFKGDAKESYYVDVDRIYVSMPTNCLVSKVEPGENEAAQTLEGFIQTEKLLYTGELSFEGRNKRTDALIRTRYGGRRIEAVDLRSYKVEAGRNVEQGIGRIERTYWRSPYAKIYYDADIAEKCDFSWSENKPVSLATRTFLDHISSVSPRTSEADDLCTHYENRAVQANFMFERRHKLLLSGLNRGFEVSLARFDEERLDVLTLGPAFDEEVLCKPFMKQTVVEAPYPVEGYAFAFEEDLAVKAVRFPRPEECLGDAVTYLKGNCPGLKYGTVKASTPYLEKLMRCPQVQSWFNHSDFATPSEEPKRFFLSPYALTTVYSGAVGEEAAKALLGEYLAPDYALDRGEPGEAENCADFKVLDNRGAFTGVWLDIKNYQLESLSTEHDKSPEENAKKYLRKASIGNASLLLAVNMCQPDNGGEGNVALLADENRRKVVSIPYLIDNDGNPVQKYMRYIKENIEHCAKEGGLDGQSDR